MKKTLKEKQIISAYGQSLKLLKDAKVYDDMMRKLEEKASAVVELIEPSK